MTAAIPRVARVFDRHWLAAVLAQTTLAGAVMVLSNLFGGGRIRLTGDASLFLYMGRQMVQGRVPYLAVFDIKPPLTHEIAAVFALLAGDPATQAAISIVVTMAAAVSIAGLLAWLTFEHTENSAAAYAAGTVPLVLPSFYRYAALGYRPKYFAALFGFAALACSLRRRDGWAGASAAAAAGCWQFGAIFPVLVVGRALSQPDEAWRAAGRAIGGIAIVAGLAVAPIALAGVDAVVAMVEQVVLASIIAAEEFDAVQRGRRLTGMGPALPVVAVGLVGAVAASVRARLTARERWSGGTTWLAVAAVWFAVQVAFFDFDGVGPDLFLLLGVAAIGYGLLIDWTDDHTLGVGIALATAGFAAAVAALHTGWSFFFVAPGPSSPAAESVAWYFWHGVPPETCHIKMAGTESAIVQQLGGEEKTRCVYNFGRMLRLVFS
jgi:hypothetical protein